jgi:hypothetical protein
MLILSGAGFIFGYAKPVPINPSLFMRGKRDLLWVALAGPLANILLLILSALILKTTPHHSCGFRIFGFDDCLQFYFSHFQFNPIPPARRLAHFRQRAATPSSPTNGIA